MTMKIVIPHPTIKPKHVKHTAAGLTIAAGASEIFNLIPHLGAILFVIGGCIAIYEPHIVHEIEIEE